MQIVSAGDNLHEMLKPILWKKKEKNWRQFAWNVKACIMEKIRKYFKFVYWNFYSACSVLTILDVWGENLSIWALCIAPDKVLFFYPPNHVVGTH